MDVYRKGFKFAVEGSISRMTSKLSVLFDGLKGVLTYPILMKKLNHWLSWLDWNSYPST